MNYETTVPAETGDSYTEEVIVTDDEARSKRRRNIVLAVIAVIAGLALVYFLTRGEEEAPFAASEETQLPAVSVVTPGRTTVEGEIQATGTLSARRPLPVGSVGEGGRVVSVPVDQGDWVRQGQVLAVIDSSVQRQQISSARAQVDVAQADANLAQANLERALKLVDRGFISQADVDRLTATRDAARARVQVARAQLGELQARTARLNIYAPASGLVLTRSVDPGQTVGGGSTPLFTIASGGEMELLARLSEEELARVPVGASATVTPVGSDKTFVGQVWQIEPTIDEQTRQGIARIALSYSPEIKPGGFASASLQSGTVVAPILPESAILTDGEGSYVFVVSNDGVAQRRPVKTGLVTSQGISVVEGLAGTERVVLRAGGFLSDGDKVKAQPVKAAS